MNAMESSVNLSESKETWSVAVVYEDTATRAQAMGVCDHLVQQFWSELEFKFHWWRTDFLEDASLATMAANDAVDAEFVIVSVNGRAGWSPSLNAWFDNWITRRGNREGALVDLTGAGATRTGHAQHVQVFLRKIARRAKMDYLTKATPPITSILPDSFESATIRAEQMTSVLDNILRQVHPPSHYGLNE